MIIYAWLDPPEDKLWLLVGLWPDSFVRLAGVVFVIVFSRQWGLRQNGAVLVIIVHNMRSAGCLCHQYSSWL